jgi:hypothetical protein
MRKRETDLKARQAALARDVARLLRERGAAAAMTPGQAVAAGLLTLGEVDLLAQQYGVRIGAGGRVARREDPPS